MEGSQGEGAGLNPLVTSGGGKYRRNRVSDVEAHGYNVTLLSENHNQDDEYNKGLILTYQIRVLAIIVFSFIFYGCREVTFYPELLQKIAAHWHDS